LAQEF